MCHAERTSGSACLVGAAVAIAGSVGLVTRAAHDVPGGNAAPRFPVLHSFK